MCIHPHSLETVYKNIDKSILPDEYVPDDYRGPTAGPIDQIISKTNFTSNHLDLVIIKTSPNSLLERIEGIHQILMHSCRLDAYIFQCIHCVSFSFFPIMLESARRTSNNVIVYNAVLYYIYQLNLYTPRSCIRFMKNRNVY